MHITVRAQTKDESGNEFRFVQGSFCLDRLHSPCVRLVQTKVQTILTETEEIKWSNCSID